MTSSTLKERVQATLKSEDTEGTFELYVTRTPGYLWALLFKKLHIHPIAVTLLSIVIGALAGYFFWWDDLYMNLIGMFLLIWANWYDCADGQLARMTGQKTLIGRILDGFAGDVWFFSIYFFLCLRLTDESAPWGQPWGIWIWLIAAFSGFHCHAKQCAVADYYRNIHLYFLKGATCPDAVVTLEPQGMVSQNIPLFLWQLHAGTGTANPQIPKVLCPRPATLSGRVAAGVERTVSDGEPPLDEIHEHPDFRYASHRAVRIAVHQHAVALLCFRDYRTRSLALLHSPCT